MYRLATIATALLLVCTGPGQGHPAMPAATTTESPYAPYETLIGEWDVGAPAAPSTMVMRFRWGTNRSYIWYGANLVRKDGEEPHFEGVLMWNGISKKLDMLLMLDVTTRAGAQESGTMSIEPDGTMVRDITATFADGRTEKFRQTFRRLSNDKVETAVLRKTLQGWTPTFPGSDRLIMTRRPAG